MKKGDADVFFPGNCVKHRLSLIYDPRTLDLSNSVEELVDRSSTATVLARCLLGKRTELAQIRRMLIGVKRPFRQQHVALTGLKRG